MESKKLKAKDLINVGIYTAIYIVIFFVVGMLNAIPVLYPFLYILIPLISGIPFMLFLTKTDKFGMASELARYMPSWMGIAAIAIIFVGALLGSLLGHKMLKKHFERAGIV